MLSVNQIKHLHLSFTLFCHLSGSVYFLFKTSLPLHLALHRTPLSPPVFPLLEALPFLPTSSPLPLLYKYSSMLNLTHFDLFVFYLLKT